MANPIQPYVSRIHADELKPWGYRRKGLASVLEGPLSYRIAVIGSPWNNEVAKEYSLHAVVSLPHFTSGPGRTHPWTVFQDRSRPRAGAEKFRLMYLPEHPDFVAVRADLLEGLRAGVVGIRDEFFSLFATPEDVIDALLDPTFGVSQEHSTIPFGNLWAQGMTAAAWSVVLRDAGRFAAGVELMRANRHGHSPESVHELALLCQTPVQRTQLAGLFEP